MDGGQDDDPEDIVDDGRAEDDLRLRDLQLAHIRQDPGRDPDARRGQGRAHEDRGKEATAPHYTIAWSRPAELRELYSTPAWKAGA